MNALEWDAYREDSGKSSLDGEGGRGPAPELQERAEKRSVLMGPL